MQITNQTIVLKIIAGIFGTILPIIILFLWKKKDVRLKPAIVGVITFIVFSQILEGIPKLIFFNGSTELSKYVWSHAWTYVLIGCLQAGIFEEIGRFVAFRFFLKKYDNPKDSITYGIGHGGIESILVLGIMSISSIAMAKMINDGTLMQSLNGLSEGQLNSINLQVTSLSQYGFFKMLLEVFERIIVMALHISLSVVVFYAVHRKKIAYLFLAILFHSIFDIPAALFQCGIITHLWLAEIILFAEAAACALFAKKIYSKLNNIHTSQE